MSILKIKDANNNFVDVPSIKGRGISSIQKTSTSGLVDTYTITYTDGTTSTFNITNGEKGDIGDCEFATFEVNNNMELVMNKTEDMLLDFNLNQNMELEVII